MYNELKILKATNLALGDNLTEANLVFSPHMFDIFLFSPWFSFVYGD